MSQNCYRSSFSTDIFRITICGDLATYVLDSTKIFPDSVTSITNYWVIVGSIGAYVLVFILWKLGL